MFKLGGCEKISVVIYLVNMSIYVYDLLSLKTFIRYLIYTYFIWNLYILFINTIDYIKIHFLLVFPNLKKYK